MNKQPQKTTSAAQLACLAAATVSVVLTAALWLLWMMSSYMPLLLCGIMLLLPTLINLVLLLPCAQPPCPQEEAPVRGLRALSGRCRSALLKQYVRHRDTLLAALVALSVLGGAIGFITVARGGVDYFKFSFLLPVLLMVIFALFVIFEKYCAHRIPHQDDAQERRYGAILKNFRAAFVMGQVTVVLTAVAAVLTILEVFKPHSLLTVLLSVLFAYQVLFWILSLVVRLLRREMTAAPDFAVPMPGVGGADLGLLTYLEKNTGITMRSLWSMKLIKTVAPYAAVGALVLLWAISGLVRIEPYQEGAHYRMGRLQEQTLSPGLHMTLPWPFDRVEVYDTKTVNKMTIGYISEEQGDNIWTQAHGGEEYLLLLGGGEELVAINLRLEYRISDLKQYLATSAAPESILQAVAYEGVTARTISTDLDHMLAADRVAFAKSFREELEVRMREMAIGIEVVSVVLESIHPPVDIAGIYQEIVSAGIQAEQIVIDAQNQATVTVIAAQTNSLARVQSATAGYYSKIAAAKQELATFEASKEADAAYPDFYRYHKYLAALTEAYRDAKIVLVGEGVDKGNIYIGNIALGN